MSDLGAIFHVKKSGTQYDAHAYTTADECPEPNLKIKFKGTAAYVKLEAKGSGDVPCYVKTKAGNIYQIKKEAVVPTGSTTIDKYGTFTVPSGIHIIKIQWEADIVYVGVTPNTTHQIYIDVEEIRPERDQVYVVCDTHSKTYIYEDLAPTDSTVIGIYWSPEINKKTPTVTDY